MKFPLAQTQLSQSLLVYQDPVVGSKSNDIANGPFSGANAIFIYVLCCERDDSGDAEAREEDEEEENGFGPRWFLKRINLDQQWMKGLAQVLN